MRTRGRELSLRHFEITKSFSGPLVSSGARISHPGRYQEKRIVVDSCTFCLTETLWLIER